jgi:PKD repeat protein
VIEEPVQFTGSVLGGTPEYTWFWEFGNGNTSTEQNPMITFHEETTYTVTLTVTDSEGNYDTKDTTVSIYPSGGTWGGDNNP